jgi:hypothetical protein
VRGEAPAARLYRSPFTIYRAINAQPAGTAKSSFVALGSAIAPHGSGIRHLYKAAA